MKVRDKLWFVLCALMGAGCWAVIIYVAVHFIRKLLVTS